MTMTTDFDDVTDLVSEDGRVRRPRPSFAFMRPRLSRWIALGFGSGLARVAPGTFGTLFAWISFSLLVPVVGLPVMAALALAGLPLGAWAVRRTAGDLGVPDHGAIVWDEIVAFWLLLCVAPQAFVAQLLAFLLFRFFDVVKPPPVGRIDRTMKTAWGVMLDDLAAAAYAGIPFALWWLA
ncbi:MAG: phosphatidylglycerophosphatase A [Lautropia sp.]